jgi:hypothetical protein
VALPPLPPPPPPPPPPPRRLEHLDQRWDSTYLTWASASFTREAFSAGIQAVQRSS